jgi:hypothetical protein
MMGPVSLAGIGGSATGDYAVGASKTGGSVRSGEIMPEEVPWAKGLGSQAVRGSKCGHCMMRKKKKRTQAVCIITIPNPNQRPNPTRLQPSDPTFSPPPPPFPFSSPFSPPFPSLPTTPRPIGRRAAVADNLKSAGARESRLGGCGQQDSPHSGLALGAESLNSDIVYVGDWSRSLAEDGLACVGRHIPPTSVFVTVIHVPTASIVEVIPATLAASSWEHDLPLIARRV